MKTKLNLLAAGIFLAALGTGFGQTSLQFSTNYYSVAENAGSVLLTVQRTGDTNEAVSVDYASANGTAIAGSDYTATSGTLTFAAGETNLTLAVPILNDGIVETAVYETFIVTLSNPTGGAVLGTRTVATGRITDNDKALHLEFTSYSVAENAGAMLIGVVRDDDGDFPVSVDFATSDSTATNGLDYTATNGTLSFAAGEKVKLFTVPILNDGLKESSETFRVTLSNSINQVLVAQKFATVTILDNDAGVQFQPLNRYWIAENEGALVLTVVRVNDVNLGPFTVDFATSNLTATAGTDYAATNGTLTFAQGEMAKTIAVPILQDEVREPGEQLKVTLTNPTADAVLGHFAAVTVTIVDTSATATPGSWTQGADMPGQASTPASCVVDGILYVMGGHYPYETALKTVWAYDPLADAWTRKADMPSVRRFAAAAAVDGIIYVVGGSGAGWPGAPVFPVAAYDPKTDTWVNKANIPTGRMTLAACAVDGIIYAIGGTASWPGRLSTVEAYDPKTNQWTTKSNMPSGLVFLTASAANGLIYVFGESSTFAYDPQTNRWTTKAQFSPWSMGLMSATVDGIIYLFGGMTEDLRGSFDFTLAYDPAQDQFTARRKMPRTRLTAACGVIDGKVYLAAGVNKEPVVNTGVVYYKTLDVFDPQGGVTPQILSLACESTNRVRLAWQGEAGIRYGVESRRNVASGSWTRASFSSGTNSVLATNSMVEVICLVPTGDTNRFFQVLEL